MVISYNFFYIKDQFMFVNYYNDKYDIILAFKGIYFS